MAYTLKLISVQNATRRIDHLWLHKHQSMLFSSTKDCALFWNVLMCDLGFKLANPCDFCEGVEL